MRNLIEQADVSRQAANHLRRHATDPEVLDLMETLKLAERLEVRAAKLEYQWLTVGATSKSRS